MAETRPAEESSRAAQGVAVARSGAGAAASTAPGLAKEVQTLTMVIKQLEEQLDQMMATNQALRKDHLDERSRRVAVEGKLEEMQAKLVRAEKQVADKDNMLAEVRHVNQERVRLAASARELGERLKEAGEQRDAETRKVERLRKAHANAVDEVQSVEAQFERAMSLVAQTQAKLTIACEERDQQSHRARTSETLLTELRQERDALVAEVEQSRAALEEIRQSLVDISAVPPQGGEAESRLPATDAARAAR
jgi:chromosome segregation ATPase